MSIKTLTTGSSASSSHPMLLKTTRRYLKKTTTTTSTTSTTPTNTKSSYKSYLKLNSTLCNVNTTVKLTSTTNTNYNIFSYRTSSTAAVKQVSINNSNCSRVDYKTYNQLENLEISSISAPTLSSIESLAFRVLSEPNSFNEFRTLIAQKQVKLGYLNYLKLLSNYDPLTDIITSSIIDSIEYSFTNTKEISVELRDIILSLNFTIFKHRLELGKLELLDSRLRKLSSIISQLFGLINNLPNEFAILQLSLVPMLPKSTKIPSMIKVLTKIKNSRISTNEGESFDINMYLGLMPEILNSQFGKSLTIQTLINTGKFNEIEDLITTTATPNTLNKINLNLLLWGFTQIGDNIRVKFILSQFYKLKVPLTKFGYSSLIRHWGNNNQLGRNLKLIDNVIKNEVNILPNEVILTNLVNSFAINKNLRGAEYYYEKCLELGYTNNLRLMTTMLNLYIELGEANIASSLIKQILEKFELDTVLVGVIIKWIALSNSMEFGNGGGGSSSNNQPYDFLINQWAKFRNLPTIELTGVLSNYLKYNSNQLPIPNLLQLIDQFILLKPEPTFCIDVFNQILKIILKSSSSLSEETYYLKTLNNWLVKHNLEPNIVTHYIMLNYYLKENRLGEAINLFCYYFPHLKNFPFDNLDPSVYKSNLELNPGNLRLGKRKLDLGLINLFMELCLKLGKPRLVPILLLTSYKYHLAPNYKTYQFILKACLLTNNSKTLYWCLINEQNFDYLPTLANCYIQLMTRNLYNRGDPQISDSIKKSRFLEQIVEIYENTLRLLYSRDKLPNSEMVYFMITALNQVEDPSNKQARIHGLLKLLPEEYNNSLREVNGKNNEDLIRFDRGIKEFLESKHTNNYLS